MKKDLKKTSTLIFVSGMPNIVKPFDFYLYLSLLMPDTFNSFPQFVVRYCKGKFRNENSLYLDTQGFSKTKELNLILREKVSSTIIISIYRQ